MPIHHPMRYHSNGNMFRREKKKKKPPTIPINSKYITDNMLTPFVPSLFLPTSELTLSISGRNLVKSHVLGKTNYFCVVSMKRCWQEGYKVVGLTEIARNTLNPEWMKKIVIGFNFETIQNIKFEIRDEDMQKETDFVGRFFTTVSALVSKNGKQSIGKLVGKIGNISYREGEIVIVAEEVVACKQTAEIQFCAENLPKSWLRSSRPFLIISRSNEDGSHSFVAKTEPAVGSQNPTWKPITIRATALCNGDFERSIRIDCYDHRDNGRHKLIGSCYTNLSMLNSQMVEPMLLVNEQKRKSKPNYVASGKLKLKEINITEDSSFLDFIRNGTQMHFAVAIDFTASNLVHTDPKSLHYLSPDPKKKNGYELALQGIGEIIQQYSSNQQLFPAFGFGAKIPPSGQVSFQFPLNDNPSHPYCSSVEDILSNYRKQLQKVELYGPTNFATVINDTANIASQFQDGKHFFVLLIITDGIISDMHLTKRAIIHASSLPISIIIIGVGDDDFSAMYELDSDDTRLTVDDSYAERDIVQFLPLKNFLSTDGESIQSQAELAEEVLAEIPEQLTSFMKSRGINSPVALPPDSSRIVPTAPMY